MNERPQAEWPSSFCVARKRTQKSFVRGAASSENNALKTHPFIVYNPTQPTVAPLRMAVRSPTFSANRKR